MTGVQTCALPISANLGIYLHSKKLEEERAKASSSETLNSFAKAIIQIYKAANGTYSGVHIRAIPRPNYVAKEYCQNCPPPFKDQKIVGMQIIWHLKPVDNFQDATWQFVEGYALDPLSGKIYRGRAKLSADHRRLTLRGYVGISALGRSQTWIREDADSQYLKDLPKPTLP